MIASDPTLRVLLLAASLSWLPLAAAEPAPDKRLTDAASVLALSGAQAAQSLPVSVTGVVTASEPDWNGQFFVQDQTGGVFVESFHLPAPVPGDRVTVEGVSHPGAFAPIITRPHWRKDGTAPLPEAKRMPIESLKAGAEDGERVEITGVVRTAQIESGRMQMDLAVAGYRLQVSARPIADLAPASLIGARVRVQGTAASHYMKSLRQLTSVGVYAPRPEDFTVLEMEQVNPFSEPATPVKSVAQYRRGRHPEQRVHVRGTVTLQRPGTDLFLQDETGGIHLETTDPQRFNVGDSVDAVGFLEYENLLPVIRDATIMRSDAPNAPLIARQVPFEEVARGEHHGDFIRLGGRVLERSTRSFLRSDGRSTGVVTTWLVQSPEITFTVEHAGGAEDPALAGTSAGSVIEADGVCVSAIEIAAAGAATKLTSLRLLLPAGAHLRLIQKPSWFTPQRLLIGLGLSAVVLLVALGWLLTIAKKNAALRRVVRELEQAQQELQDAHDTLEEKVAERSAQLQVEMTARKTSELQFKGGLAERTRLARDLHDTLEQTLAGIALHLNAAGKLSRRDPAASDEHLRLARNWLHQSQVDLRRSIWDLRSRELEQFDLAGALRRTAEQMTVDTELRLDFQADPPPPGLPEVVEENVLRIGQEALTNIGKHARATRVTIRLGFTPHLLRLQIEDNGAGFVQDSTPSEGHFGLMGMGERAKRLAGRLVIQSVPGRGTSLLLEIPLETGGQPSVATGAGTAATSA